MANPAHPSILSPSCLLALRRSATLAHALPVGVRLRVDDATVLLVRRPAEPCHPSELPSHPAQETVRVLHPCAFRAAVGTAYRWSQEGREVALVNAEREPAVDLAVRLPDVTLPGGGVRCRSGRTVVWAIPTVLGPAAAATCLEAWRPEDAPPVVRAEHHWDPVTDIGIMSFECDLTDTSTCRAGDRVALDLAAHVAVTELLADLRDLPSDPAGADAPR
jgi:hypothetical protein